MTDLCNNSTGSASEEQELNSRCKTTASGKEDYKYQYSINIHFRIDRVIEFHFIYYIHLSNNSYEARYRFSS